MKHTNYRNALGPGDLWGSPPDDPPLTQCEHCGDEFEFDPTPNDSDGETQWCVPPARCANCEDKVRWTLVEPTGNGALDRVVGCWASRDSMMCALSDMHGTFRFWAECDGELIEGTENERRMS